MSAVTFAHQFLRNWKETGAILPSSHALAHRMCESANVPHARRVLELGPGTGPITRVIEDMMPAGCEYLGIESNPVFVEQLRKRFRGLRFEQAFAQEFAFHQCLPEGGGYDAIVSGLPWTAFPESLQLAILHHVLPHLAPNGSFVTFAYWGFHKLPQGQHFRDLLRQQPGHLRVTPVVWANVPPAFVYVVQR